MPAAKPSEPLRVFISYTAEDLIEHAKAAVDAVRKKGWVAVDHRDWTGTGQPALKWCLEKVQSCELLIVLVAHRYGWVPDGDDEGGDGERSVTWLEVAEARGLDKSVLPFVLADDADWKVGRIEALTNPVAGPRLGQFKAALNKTIRGSFSTPESVERLVFQALTEVATERRKAAEAEAEAALTSKTGQSQGTRTQATPTGRTSLEEAIADYRRRTEARLRHLSLLGMGDQLTVRLPLAEAYVKLRASLPVSFSRAEEAGASKAALKDGRFDRIERDIDLDDAFRKAEEFGGRRGVALLGDPGSGKTTAARHVVWRCADAVQGPESLGLPRSLVPVLLPLRRLERKHLDAGLRGMLLRELKSAHLGQHKSFGKHLYKRGGVLWVLDGLDEVADPVIRGEVSRWIEEAVDERPDDRFLVTSRYAGYRGDAVLDSRFMELHVQPLDDEQKREFVGRWYRAVERFLLGATPEAEQRAREKIDKLVELLTTGDFRVRPRLASMAANPLLLSILCVVHREQSDLPRRRADLYQRCTDVLLHHWRVAADLPGLDVNSARAVLQPLAWWMHQEKDRTEAPASALAKRAQGILDNMGSGAPAASGEAFLDTACDASGLVVRPSPGKRSFLHLSFQEYLAAGHAVGSPARAVELAERFGDSWWKEPTLLALGQGSLDFALAFFTRLLADGAIEADRELAALCVDEALQVPMAPFVALLKRKKTPAERLRVVLDLLRGRKDAALLGAVRGLLNHKDSSVTGAAGELLLLAGEALPEPAVEREPVAAQAGDKPEAAAPQQWLHPKSGIVMVLAPSGEFLMGSPQDEEGRWNAEGPQHAVRIEHPFWIAKYPVTNEEYGRFLAASPDQEEPEYWQSSQYNQPRQPVVGVSWPDAVAYCQWAGLFLPTEGLWEYAARGGTQTRFWSGDGEERLAEVGWFAGNSGRELHPVGEKPANAWGLHDVHGNIWEWTSSPSKDYYGKRVKGSSDGGGLRSLFGLARTEVPAVKENVGEEGWDADPSGGARVVRGGSWGNPARYARSAYRGGGGPSDRANALGFRPVLAASPSS